MEKTRKLHLNWKKISTQHNSKLNCIYIFIWNGKSYVANRTYHKIMMMMSEGEKLTENKLHSWE